MNWKKWIRQTHRWLSMAFTVSVIVNIVAVVQGKYSSRLGGWPTQARFWLEWVGSALSKVRTM